MTSGKACGKMIFLVVTTANWTQVLPFCPHEWASKGLRVLFRLAERPSLYDFYVTPDPPPAQRGRIVLCPECNPKIREVG